MADIILSGTGLLAGVIAIIFGILVLKFPNLLRYLVAAGFIIIGAVGILGAVL